jgi:hypothetical protein
MRKLLNNLIKKGVDQQDILLALLDQMQKKLMIYAIRIMRVSLLKFLLK